MLFHSPDFEQSVKRARFYIFHAARKLTDDRRQYEFYKKRARHHLQEARQAREEEGRLPVYVITDRRDVKVALDK